MTTKKQPKKPAPMAEINPIAELAAQGRITYKETTLLDTLAAVEIDPADVLLVLAAAYMQRVQANALIYNQAAVKEYLSDYAIIMDAYLSIAPID